MLAASGDAHSDAVALGVVVDDCVPVCVSVPVPELVRVGVGVMLPVPLPVLVPDGEFDGVDACISR